MIDSGGTVIGDLPISHALDLAEKRGLDLVEVNAFALPPACRLMDFARTQYLEKKAQRAKRRRSRHKELRFSPRTCDHDIRVKLQLARSFLRSEYPVKFTLFNRGRDRLTFDQAQQKLLAISARLATESRIQHGPHSDSRRSHWILLAPVSEQLEANRDAK